MTSILLVALWAQGLFAQDTEWLDYGGGPHARRFSELSEINASNVARLAPKWIYQTGVGGKFETVPLITRGRMFLTGPANHAWALDLLTGRPLWHINPGMPDGINACCGPMNRGFAISGERLFKVTFEGDLIAYDLSTGKPIWKKTLADFKKGYSATGAPLVVKNLVLTGIAGAEFGTRGFVDAYDVATGERKWRFWTVPTYDEPGGKTWPKDFHERGGGSTWVTGTYDPELNLVYWGTGNPGPDMDGDVRPGDNLYTCSVVALDADTGKLKWHFQFTPHDVHDWDAVGDPTLADIVVKGAPVKALLFPNRNGFYYTLDRTNGKLIAAKPFTKVSWATEIKADGKPALVAGQDPSDDGVKSCPGLGGGHNWWATSYSPQSKLHYFGSIDGCQIYFKTEQPFVEGAWYQASTTAAIPAEPSTASLVAVDPVTAETKWRVELAKAPSGGVLSTAGGLVFYGDQDGWLAAYDAKSGKVLWRFQTGGQIAAPPVSYRFRGKQYLALVAGGAVIAFGLP
ncbi:MAG: PQQ-dependent dehydrogenase, methanol/ethanol family [Bryobacteraceae bacterium]|nr:PQQ-dependent dehydrogenase, methanol/ethanol family [Bryobacteraceae bacterium]